MIDDPQETLFKLRKMAFQLSRAELGISIIEWEAMPLVELYQWYNDVKRLSDEEQQASGSR